MLPSGNDAAIALAKWGGEILGKNPQNALKLFISYMNKCCKAINMKMSKFENPHGLSNQNSVSNPEDVALLIV